MIGFSSDTVETQYKFIEKEKLTYLLIGDTEKKLMGALGTAGRTTYVFGKDGKLAKVFTKVSPKGHPEEVLKFVEESLKKK